MGSNRINWEGPQNSPEYPKIMFGLVSLCVLGFASVQFPVVGWIVSGLIIVGMVGVVIAAIAYIISENRKDKEALYGYLKDSYERDV